MKIIRWTLVVLLLISSIVVTTSLAFTHFSSGITGYLDTIQSNHHAEYLILTRGPILYPALIAVVLLIHFICARSQSIWIIIIMLIPLPIGIYCIYTASQLPHGSTRSDAVTALVKGFQSSMRNQGPASESLIH